MDIETAITHDEAFALTLLDIEKFYDSVPLASLIKAGLKLGYSPTLLCLNVSICLASRSLKTRNGASEFIQPLRSIVAGLGEANNLAKVVIYAVCEEHTKLHLNVRLKTFVDDMTQFIRGECNKVAVDAAKAAKFLAKGPMNIGYVISFKSQLLTNSDRVEHLVTSALKGVGVEIKIVKHAVDLGGGPFS